MDTMTTEKSTQPVEVQSADAAASGKNEKARKLPKLLKSGKRKRRWLRVAVIAVILVLIVRAGMTFLGGGGDVAAVRYGVAQAERRDLGVSVSGSATLRPADAYQVTALVSGAILEAPFEELSTVQKGDLLYTIDSSSAQTSVDSASIAVRQQEMAYREALDAKTPRATISGTVSEVFVRDGDSVSAGDQLLELVSDLDVTADFLFTYVKPSEFQAGQRADVFIAGYEGSVEGTVVSVSDGSSLTTNGKEACTVRVKIKNPGALVEGDDYNASAVIGSYCSYGSTRLNMSGRMVVRAAAGGTVSGLTKLLGSTVKQGEALCTISSKELDDRIETARLSIQSAQLQVSSAQDSMDRYTITSPISGTVIQKAFKAGDKVNGADSGALAEIYDLSCLKMDLDVNELDIGKVAVGQRVTLTAAALPGESFEGVVDKVGIAGKTSNGFTTYPVTVVVTDYGELRPGMNVSATIQCDTVEGALCVPVDAVARGNTVLVPGEGALGPDGTLLDETKLESREVVLGRSDEEYVQITSGLEEGESVAYLAAQTDPAGSAGTPVVSVTGG